MAQAVGDAALRWPSAWDRVRAVADGTEQSWATHPVSQVSL